jgi:hypothetical protein
MNHPLSRGNNQKPHPDMEILLLARNSGIPLFQAYPKTHPDIKPLVGMDKRDFSHHPAMENICWYGLVGLHIQAYSKTSSRHGKHGIAGVSGNPTSKLDRGSTEGDTVYNTSASLSLTYWTICRTVMCDFDVTPYSVISTLTLRAPSKPTISYPRRYKDSEFPYVDFNAC